MNNSTPKTTEINKLFAARLTGYVAAAGALITLTPDSNAQVEYSGEQDIFLNGNDYTYIDLNKDSISDVEFGVSMTAYKQYFTTNSSSFWPYNIWWRERYVNNVMMYMNPYYNNSVIETYFYNIAPLPERYLVGQNMQGYSSNYWISDSFDRLAYYNWSYVYRSFSYYWYYSTYSWGTDRRESFNDFNYSSGGNFIYQEDKFIGLKINNGIDDFYGWLRVNVPYFRASVEIKDWAYQKAAGRGLYTGIDSVAPGVSMNLDLSGEPIAIVDINFDEEILDTLQASDFTIINGHLDSLVEVNPYRQYRAYLTLPEHGDLTFELPENKIRDLWGNTNAEEAVYFDRIPGGGYNGISSIDGTGIKLYPNPVSSILHVELPTEGIITITDASGRVLIAKENIYNDLIDVSSFEAGMYVIKIQTKNGIAVKKVIKE